MTTQELMENANLAALGLLDPQEHIAYERALLAAPDAVRDRIIRDQARWASGEGLLPDVSAPEGLRGRVIEAVRNAMVEEQVHSTSLAHGLFAMPGVAMPGVAMPGVGTPGVGMPGVPSAQSNTQAAWQSVGKKHVPAYWRVAAVGLMAACVALVGVTLFVSQSASRTGSVADQNSVLQATTTPAGNAIADDLMFSAATRQAIMESNADFVGKATIYSNPDWKRTIVFTSRMPTLAEGKTYRIIEVTDENTFVRELATLGGSPQREMHTLPQLSAGTRLAIVEAAVGSAATTDRLLLLGTVG
jgi:hypothetical protein